MNIDLLITKHGESGLLCDRPFEDPASGAIFDAETKEITLEFGESGETLHLNIQVEESFKETLLFSHKIHMGILSNGLFAQSLQLPLLYLNDPYGSEFGQETPMSISGRTLLGFEQFMKRCVTGQPVHRENLADEDTAGCVLRGMDPHALKFVPELVRQRMLEAGPKISQTVSGPYVGGPVMGGPGGAKISTGSGRRTIQQPPQEEDSTE